MLLCWGLCCANLLHALQDFEVLFECICVQDAMEFSLQLYSTKNNERDKLPIRNLVIGTRVPMAESLRKKEVKFWIEIRNHFNKTCLNS